MLVQLTSMDPIWTLFTVIGILTLFGKKKKDEKEDGETVEVSTPSATLTPSSPTSSIPIQPPPVPAGSPTPPNPAPMNASTSYQPQRISRAFTTEGLSEWVPPRATPTSRPMVIIPGGKKGAETDKTAPTPSPPATTAPPPPAPPARFVKPPDPVQQTPKEAFQPKFYPPPSSDKPEKPVRDEAPKRPSPPKVSQSFDHIFELTQGNLDSPGLVVVNGAQGSGKTTLCSGLASSFLKQGSPCMFVTYDKAPGALRDQMKKIGADPSEAESQYRFLLVDGFSAQSDSFSFEPYYVEKAFDFDSIQDALVKNSSMFIGEKTKILFDSIDPVVAKVASKDFVKRLGEALDKLRDSNVTLVVTVDLSKAPKDVVKWLEDTASCVIDLDKDDSDPNGRELKVRKLNGSTSKLDTETFEIDSGKGLVFVK